MQYKSKIFTVDIEIYNSRLHVFSGCTDEEVIEYITEVFPGAEYKRPNGSAAAFTLVNKDGSEQYMIDFIRHLKRKDARSHKAIAHEVSHTVWEISNDIGLNCGYNNQETFAYLLGYLVQKITEEVFI